MYIYTDTYIHIIYVYKYIYIYVAHIDLYTQHYIPNIYLTYYLLHAYTQSIYFNKVPLYT